MMARFSASAHHTCHCASAAAGTSARIISLMDTASILVVSIFVCRLCLRLWV